METKGFRCQAFPHHTLPTRWGNYLNGNLSEFKLLESKIDTPHSLGKLFEWKLEQIFEYSSIGNAITSPLAGEII